MTIQFKDAAGFHETEDGSGIFEGYASVFGNVDSYGDKVMPGAFTKSLAKSFPNDGAGIPCYWSHRMDDPEFILGKTLSAVEDEHGLKVRVSLDLENPKAEAAYRALKAGAVNQMSFAYEVIDSHFIPEKGAKFGGVNELRELNIFEVSVVQIGANTATSIDMVKSAMKNDDSVSISTPGAIERLEEAVEILREIIDSAKADGSDEESDNESNSEESETANEEAPAPVKSCKLSDEEREHFQNIFNVKK
jgi:HK97 family phage prohead protease|nr:MAG TPA: prohead serine protease [Caudoviricetes sp.]